VGGVRGGQVRCVARVPDHGYYHKLAGKHDGHNGKNPTLAVERKILRRCYHTLRALGDAALAMPSAQPQEVAA
jgi:transposase